MPVDYDSIRTENLRKYGEEIDRIGRMLLSERYDDQTHFIFEILQNAEDALKKRGGWNGPHSVKFSLFNNSLTISHFGKPFDEADVRGVCGIGESTKKLTDIGRFGIGFKSVYAFTKKPEIHSSGEHFAIESYVWPRATRKRALQPEETKIHIPFKRNEPSAKEEILKGLQRLGPRTLLFLREIDEISWSVSGGPSGRYHRSNSEVLGNGIQKVRVVGQNDTLDEVKEEWLVFSREVYNRGTSAGHVEIAFQLRQGSESRQNPSVQRVVDSHLVVFFPTVLSTNLGFVVQGPYRTTPSRDNVPQNDLWNRHLVQETSVLLVDALTGLRELDLLNVSTLQCLPLRADWFAEWNRFAPLFQAVKEALRTEPLLPTYGGGHIAAQNAKLARTQDLRDLISPNQLAILFPSDDNPAWLSDSITADRTPELRRYITEELDVTEVTPEWLVPRLTAKFLEVQPDEWIERLYEFLHGQRARELRQRLRTIPLVRLENGYHTIAFIGGKPQAYLPGDTQTGFPTVKRSVCQSPEARSFLESLGLRVPDPVDDVITNILPKYARDPMDISDEEYQSDIKRMLDAFDTDSNTQRNNLLSALREAKFVVAVDAGTSVSQFVRPSEAYLATERLTSLFEGVPNVFIVDNSKECLRGERIRDLLRAAGTPEYLASTPVEPSLTHEDKRKLRYPFDITHEVSLQDYTLMGLDSLLSILATMPVDQASSRAALLWQALRDVQQRRGNTVFNGIYRWFRYTSREATFPARFVQTLNETAWVPDKSGTLQPPSAVVFEDTGWVTDPSLTARILFMPGTLNELAKETGIELGALGLLKKLGCTSEAELRKRLGIPDDTPDNATSADSLEGKNGVPNDGEQEPTTPSTEQTDNMLGVKESAGSDSGNSSSSNRTTASSTVSEVRLAGATSNGHQNQTHHNDAQSDNRQNDGPGNSRKPVTYVRVNHNETDEDPEGLSYQERMDLEAQAIALILAEEKALKRTPPNNPGFDLTEPGPNGETVRWIEVKSLKGAFNSGWVGMSSTQFKCAQEHQDAYWLYVVENTGDPKKNRILRIKDPAGKAQTFTFDHGWTEVSENPN